MPNPEKGGVNIYEVTSRSTGAKHFTVAASPKGACNLHGWDIEDCFVKEVQPHYQPGKKETLGLLVTIPCKLCLYQYSACDLPLGQQCPCKPTTPEINEWVRQAMQSHLCNFVGQSLTRKHYEQSQKTVPLSQAVEELTPNLP